MTVHHLRHASRRHGFSLLELMISIMILGIGMVMVATIFPIGLEMSRETIQIDLSQSIADAAVATCRLKVPALANYGANEEAYYFAPNMSESVFLDNEYPAPETAFLAGLTPPATSDPLPAINWPPPGTFTGLWDAISVYTGESGWLGDRVDWKTSGIVPSQNLLVDSYRKAIDAGVLWENWFDRDNRITTLRDPMIDPDGGPGLPVNDANELPCVSLLDQVYPPVLADEDFDRDGTPGTVKDVIETLASRRYSWSVIHRRASRDTDVNGFLLTIPILYRPDLTARFARQLDYRDTPWDPPRFVFRNDGTDIDELTFRQPRPAPAGAQATDTLFPRPWLVVLDEVSAKLGEVFCTHEIAQILPAGSYMIVAAADDDNRFSPGSVIRVLDSSWDYNRLGGDPDDASYIPARLAIPRQFVETVNDLLVWVYPPPIVRDSAQPTFGPRSPVVGVALRQLTPE